MQKNTQHRKPVDSAKRLHFISNTETGEYKDYL